MRVLVIDDDDAVLKSLVRMLRPPHEVTTASATEALSLLQHERFDAILCDIRMPDVDGPTLVSRLAPDVTARVVFMTGGSYIPLWVAAGHRILAKPFSREKALEALAEAANRAPRGTKRYD